MSTLTLLDRLTLKRNILLQKQLHVRLQIMGEEYRMTRNNLDRDTRDISDFLVYIRHTVPGLNCYSQPDTRSMKANDTVIKRRKEIERGGNECIEENTEKGEGRDDERKDEVELSSHPSASPSNISCHRRIFGDKNTHCHLEQMKIRKKRDPETEDPSLNHCVTFYRKEAQMKIVHTDKSTLKLKSHRTQSPKYGRDACTNEDEAFRKNILSQFEAIFNLNDAKQVDQIYLHKIKEDPAVLPENKDLQKSITQSQQASFQDHEQTRSYTPTITSSNHILKRRLTWSAPHRHRQDGKKTANTSAVPHLQCDGSLQNKCTISCSETAEMTTCQQRHVISVMPKTSHGELNAKFSSTTGQHQRNVNRPKTAPSKYELKQKGLLACRQQVAGFLADIQSRKADTRAILKRSRQLQEMVRTLAIHELSEDSLSD